jgi:hypothetical protein
LTRLQIDYGYSKNVAILFIDILQNLVRLESLTFYFLQVVVEMHIEDNAFYSKLAIINPSRKMKSLRSSLITDTMAQKDIMEMCNRLFRFVLQSCPLLQTFHLSGNIEACGAFSLGFRHLDQLKEVKFEMRHYKYYIFYHISGRRWSSINKLSTEYDLTAVQEERYPYYYINLAWKTTAINNIGFELADGAF